MLYQRVLRCADAHEFELLRQYWDEIHRPKYCAKACSEKQQEVLDLTDVAVSYEDEEEKKMCLAFRIGDLRDDNFILGTQV